MDVKDFKIDFIENIKAEAATTGEGACASFVRNMAQYLIDTDVLPDFNSSYYEGTGKGNRKYRVDGYVLDEFDYTMNLFIANFDGINERTITKTIANQDINRLSYFVQQAIETNLYREIEISTPCSDLVDLLREKQDQIRRYKLFILSDATISATIKTFDSINIDGKIAEIQLWNIDRIFKVCTSEATEESIEINFLEFIKTGIPCLEASCAEAVEYKSYLCIIPGQVLADIYDRYGSQLLEGNVRSFLSTKVAVNKKIRETIITKPTMFFAFNNGVSATALDVTLKDFPSGKVITSAKNFQIINGGQTTASLSNTRHKDRNDLANIYVQMKLTQIGEMSDDKATELVQNISRSSNSQNKVSEADFFATHPFHVRIEQFSRRIYAPTVAGEQYDTKWFYERARGQYVQAQMRMTPAKKKQFMLQNPKSKVITKTDLAKYRNSWDGFPNIVSKGAQTNFMKFADRINEKWENNDTNFNERYFQESVALAILFKYAEQLVTKQPWYEQGYRANIVTYSIALLHKLINEQFNRSSLNLMIIWNKQKVPDDICKALVMITENVFRSITAEDRPTINVTQWCKREACWQRVQNIKIDLPSDLLDLMMSVRELKTAEKEAKADQKIITGVEAQSKVLEYSAEQWLRVLEFSKSKNIGFPDELNALKIAIKIPLKIPNPYQSQKLLSLLNRLAVEGFKI